MTAERVVFGYDGKSSSTASDAKVFSWNSSPVYQIEKGLYIKKRARDTCAHYAGARFFNYEATESLALMVSEAGLLNSL